jgi:hypothetical protein
MSPVLEFLAGSAEIILPQLVPSPQGRVSTGRNAGLDALYQFNLPLYSKIVIALTPSKNLHASLSGRLSHFDSLSQSVSMDKWTSDPAH